jgi:ketosteroid isomerase-like protein
MHLIAAAVVLALTLGWASGATAAVDELDSGLQAANDAEVNAFLAADTKALTSLWADTFVVNNPLGKFVAGPQVLGMVSSGMLRFASFTRSIDYAHSYGDVAILAGIETCGWAGRFPLAGQVSHVRFTSVWRRSSDGKWLEVARHADILPDRSR